MKASANRRVVAIIQARMGSSRLPGKILKDIAGKPLLQHVIERTRSCSEIDEVIVASTNEPEDIVIKKIADAGRASHFFGNRNDVLDRFYKAALSANADIIVRVTGDDPFIDPRIIAEFIRHFQEHPGLDIVCESIDEPTYPEGVTCSVISFKALARAWKEARLASEREHVIPYIIKHPGQFKIAFMLCHKPLNHHRWTLDYPEDLEFARAIYRKLGHLGIFSMKNILELLEREPELAKINQGFVRNAGYKRSLQADHTTSPKKTAA